jgi:hypothetical protein
VKEFASLPNKFFSVSFPFFLDLFPLQKNLLFHFIDLISSNQKLLIRMSDHDEEDDTLINPTGVAAALEVTKDYRSTNTKWVRRDTIPQSFSATDEASSWGLPKRRGANEPREYLAVSVPNFSTATGLSLLEQLQRMAEEQDPKDYRQDAWIEERLSDEVVAERQK